MHLAILPWWVSAGAQQLGRNMAVYCCRDMPPSYQYLDRMPQLQD